MRELLGRATGALLLAAALTSTLAHAQSGLDQRAVVFLKTKCENRQTGATPEKKGTGFIVERSGYVLTAYHVVSCWNPESRQDDRRTSIEGHIGSPWEPPPRTLELLRFDEQSDVAILKFLGLPHEYQTLKVCALRRPPRGMRFVAAGFPEGMRYQPVDGRVGTAEAGGGRWSAASPFTRGMSGGPVAHNGFVVGLIKGGHVKGGVADVAALSEITPIYRARTIIESEVGLRLPECSARQPEPGRQPERCDGVTVALGGGGSTCIRPGSGESFRDCPDCPEMVVVPAGSFMMGSPPSEPDRSTGEGPQHRVTIARPFAVGRFEVTFAEWDACVAAGGCSHRPGDSGWGRGRRPVINVSWNDITNAYLPWLSRKSGKTYRLLTEAEWEYAARAGTTTRYAFGDTIGKSQAQYSEGAVRSAGRTVEAGSFPANRFGLYDMHGNVWEWVQDCWNGDYSGAPSDGSAWRTGICGPRVLRGGAWFNVPQFLRSANRTADDRRTDSYGFRVGRTF